jgi:flagellum-specific peptidoglycan hydrolase FlgJ
MSKNTLIHLFIGYISFFLFPINLLSQVTNTELRLQFVARFYKTAQIEQQKFGIPASISLAQGIIESNAGNSRLARMTNNFFGLKCFQLGCTLAHCGIYADDSKSDRFRKYTSPWQSWRDHSKFLAERAHYQFLFETQDWRKWADGLDEVGYASDKNYCQKLTKIITDFKLYVYDLPSTKTIAKPTSNIAKLSSVPVATPIQRTTTNANTQRFGDDSEGIDKR